MKKIFFVLVVLIAITHPFSRIIAKDNLQHPFLLVNPAIIAQTRNDITTFSWKAAAWQRLKKEADKFLLEQLEIPQRGGNWEHYYINPKTGEQLQTGKLLSDFHWQHFDKKTGEVISTDTSANLTDYDGVVISLIHDAWSLGAVELGLAYQISNNEAYALKAKNILLEYAALYPKLTQRNRYGANDPNGMGKIHLQDLNEAQWLTNMVTAADLIWQRLAPAEQQVITTQLIHPAVQLLMNTRRNVSNIQCWKNAAIGLAGFLTDTQSYIDYAIKDSATGLQAQLALGFTPDGLQADISPSYHYYTLQALVILVQAAEQYGYAVNTQQMLHLFQTPLQLATPSLQLPALNDSRVVTIPAYGFLYEWSYAKFRDSLSLDLIKHSPRSAIEKISPCFTGYGLFFGVGGLPVSKTLHPSSINLEKTGIAKLSVGEKEQNLSCYFKYTNQQKRRTHYHYAQLEFGIMKGKEQIAVIPGNFNYASPLHLGYYRSSIAHNTFTIGEKDQRPSNAKLIEYNTDKGIPYILAETNENDKDFTRFVRGVLVLDENTVLVVDQYYSTRLVTPTIDITYHQAGFWLNKPVGDTIFSLPEKPGYKYLFNPTIQKQQQTFHFATSIGMGRKIVTSGTATSPFDLITASGPAFENNTVPTIMCRFSQETFVMAYVISAKGEQPTITVHHSTDKEVKITVTSNSTIYPTLHINPDKLLSNNRHVLIEKQ